MRRKTTKDEVILVVKASNLSKYAELSLNNAESHDKYVDLLADAIIANGLYFPKWKLRQLKSLGAEINRGLYNLNRGEIE
jgi:hypothetical protein